jgi:ATP-dependent DNA helicase 2 subunit 2
MTQLVEDCDGNVFDAEEALDILSDFQTKKVKPTTIFRGPLTLGDEQKHGLNALSMEVFVYSKTMEVKLPSAKKWSALPEARSHRVNMERTYHMAHNPEEEEDEEPGVGPEVLKDDLIRAYRYGKVLVPFTEEDEDAMKIKTMKSMQVLGFIKMDKVIPPHRLMIR